VCLVYQMVDQDYYARPSAGYLSCIQEGYEAHGVPQDQLEIVQSFQAEQQWWNTGRNFSQVEG
jgi:hypothetical protein